MRHFLLCLFSAMLILVACNETANETAQPPALPAIEDVQLVSESPVAKTRHDSVLSLVSFITDKANRSRFLVQKFYPKNDGSVQVVFVTNKKRYTLYYSGDDITSQFLSFWVRPNGTTSRKVGNTWTDDGLDLVVDFGISGDTSQSDKERKTFFGASMVGESMSEGEEYQPYWQDQYRTALHEITRHFNL